MKNLTCILFVVFVTLNAHAQQLSAGARLGASHWMHQRESESLELKRIDGQHITFDKTAFLRYETKGRIALELGLSYNRLKYDHADETYDGPYSGLYLFYKTNFTTIDASFQVDVTCSHLKSCPVFKKFRSFIGVTLSPVFMGKDMHIPAETYRAAINKHTNEFQLWAGLNNTLSYDVNRSFSITSAVNLRANPFEFRGWNDRYYPTARISFQLGAAYKFH